MYAAANAATDLKEEVGATIVAATSKANAEQTMALAEVKQDTTVQMGALTEAMTLLSKAMANKETKCHRSVAAALSTSTRAQKTS